MLVSKARRIRARAIREAGRVAAMVQRSHFKVRARLRAERLPHESSITTNASLLSCFTPFCGRGELAFRPIRLDTKQTEVLRTLLVHPPVSVLDFDGNQSSIPVFLAGKKETEADFCSSLPPFSIFLDLHDNGSDFLSLSREMLCAIDRFRLDLIYFKLQIHDPRQYRTLNLLPRNVHVISCPMLARGSRFHITTQEDFRGDALFRFRFNSNLTPEYSRNWSWVGAPTSEDRVRVLRRLEDYASEDAFSVTTRPGHSDAALATIPFDEYIRLSRASKICLSMNGNGPWCLKDGELLSNHCFVLRQWHPAVALNPLSPKEGVHWSVFHEDEVIDRLEHYLTHSDEREDIRNRGHAYFRLVLFHGLWADSYLSSLRRFLETREKGTWGDFAIA